MEQEWRGRGGRLGIHLCGKPSRKTFHGGSVGKESACKARDLDSIPGSGRSPGVVESGNPLQYSCLGNPMDRGAWWAIVHGVAELDMTRYTENQRDDRYGSQGSAYRGEVLKSTGCFCILSDTGSEWVRGYLFCSCYLSPLCMYDISFFVCLNYCINYKAECSGATGPIFTHGNCQVAAETQRQSFG